MNKKILMELKKQAFDKYSQLAGNLDASLKTTICAFYLYNQDLDSIELCSFGSGTKAVGQNKLLCGYKLHTCHAEIIAKRGFQLWIYNALEQNKEKYFDQTQTNRLKLRANFKLYVYISQPPCGQCSLFQESKIYGLSAARPFIYFDIPASREIDFDNNKLRSTPTNSKTPIKHRNPSYCCSDKIMMWTVLGVQGSLISLLIEPIYIECLLIDYRENFCLMACINAETRGKCSREAILKLNNKMISRSFKIKKPKIFYGKNKMFEQSPFHQKNDNYNKRIQESDLEQNYQSYSYLFVSPQINEKINSLTGLKWGVAKKNENNVKLLPSISKFVLFQKFKQITKLERNVMMFESKQTNYKYRLIKEQLLNQFTGRSTSKQSLEQFY